MKVAMVSEHASPLAVLGGVDAGGQNVHVASLARALARRGVEVTVYTRRDARELPERVPFGARVSVEHVAAGPPEPIAKDALLPFMDEFALHLAKSFQRERPDLVHAHFWMSGKAALAAALPLGLPVLETFHALGVVKRRHQGAADTSPPERLAIERDLIARTTGIIATCRDEVEELRELGASLPRVRIVPCGVDLSSFRPDGPIAPRRGKLRHRVVVVTRLVERKGVDVVIRALPALPDTELVIAGGPDAAALDREPEARRLSALAAALGVAERVTLLGRVEREDVPALLRSADAVACCPWYEPFGIVPLEAMACGVPVVASSVGGLLDTVTDGVTGIHVPPRDPGAVAAALRRLLDDGAARSRLGAAGAVRAHLGYGWDHVAAATLSAYRALALRRRGQRPRALPAAAASARSRREGSLHGIP